MTLDELRGLNMHDALVACDCLDSQSRRALLSQCSPTDHRPLFALRVVEELVVPEDLSIGLTGLTTNWAESESSANGSVGDFGEARMYILQKMAKTRNDPKVQTVKQNCWDHWFYPEYKNIVGVRERLVQVARDHVWLDFQDLMQITLFGLNGFFGWNNAQSSAQTHTTCGIFVRACRAAAHLLERKLEGTRDWPTNAGGRIDFCITGPTPGTAAVQYATRGGRTPRQGDIFHVVTPGKDNDHVGILLEDTHTDADGNWLWVTAEGGQAGKVDYYKTEFFRRTLAFRDGQHWHGSRPVRKWIDIETLARSL